MFLFFEKQGRLAAVLQLIFLKIRFSAIAQFFFLQQVKFNRRRLSIVQTGRFYAKNKTFSFTILPFVCTQIINCAARGKVTRPRRERE